MRNLVVTGCNRGIGLALVKKLVQSAQNHVVMACRNVDKANTARASILQEMPNASLTVQQLDVADEDSISSFIKNLQSKGQNIDILVNNAGFAGPMNNQDYQMAKKTFNTNFYGPVKLSESILPIISKNGRVLFSGGYIGKLNQIKNQQFKARLKKEGLTGEQLKELMDEYMKKVQEKTLGADGLPKWFYTASKIGINFYPQILKNNPVVIEKQITTYSYCPGWTKTDMTGNKGKQTVQQAVATPFFLIQLKKEECKKEEQGGFFEKCAISKLD